MAGKIGNRSQKELFGGSGVGQIAFREPVIIQVVMSKMQLEELLSFDI